MNRPKSPAATPKGGQDKQARIEREASALRENLRKRKEQARARAEPDPARSPEGWKRE